MKTLNTKSFDYSISLVSSLSKNEKNDLFKLLTSHYKKMQFDEIFERYEQQDYLYVIQVRQQNKLVASRQLYYVPFVKLAPKWAQKINQKLPYSQFVIGSRAIVAKKYQGCGLGQKLIKQGNNFAFNQLKVPAVLGSSTSLKAIKLYLKLGVNIWQPSFESLPSSITSECQSTVFENLISASSFINARLAKPIRYIYFKDKPPYNLIDNLYTGNNLVVGDKKELIQA